jgi:hypothetical protein
MLIYPAALFHRACAAIHSPPFFAEREDISLFPDLAFSLCHEPLAKSSLIPLPAASFLLPI